MKKLVIRHVYTIILFVFFLFLIPAKASPTIVIATDPAHDVQYIKYSTVSVVTSNGVTLDAIDIISIMYAYNDSVLTCGIQVKGTPQLLNITMYTLQIYFTATSADKTITAYLTVNAVFGSFSDSSVATIATLTYDLGDSNGEYDVFETQIDPTTNLVYWVFDVTGNAKVKTALDGSISVDSEGIEAQTFYTVNGEYEYYTDILDDQSGSNEDTNEINDSIPLNTSSLFSPSFIATSIFLSSLAVLLRKKQYLS